MLRLPLGSRRVLAGSIVLLWLIGNPLHSQDSKPAAGKSQAAPTGAPLADTTGHEYSGMYSFRKEGEFVQVTVEEGAHVTGFVSRYGDGESDKGEFLDQFFKSAKLDGNKLTFTTQTVHGTWFVFDGTVERGSGKMPGDEDYYVLKGKLTENATDADKHTTSQSREVSLKRFPADLDSARTPQN